MIENHVLIIRHVKEREHPFNTALMAKLQINNLILLDSDNPHFKSIIIDFIEKYKPILIFKNNHSKEIEELEKNRKQNLILLDGTWDKARSLLLGNQELLGSLPTYHFSEGDTPKTIYKSVRKACAEEALSTLEALVYSLEYLNGESYESLLAPLSKVVEEQKKWASKDPS
ncbi:DTW domain protein [Bacteriovorax sp. Seq25_V]|nr:DTW domain protein [Bacteriovorax sp. Seq25_V]